MFMFMFVLPSFSVLAAHQPSATPDLSAEARQRASAALSMSCHARQPPARSRDDAVGEPPTPRAPEDGERTAPSHRPGRRVQNPNRAWACPGRVLGLLVHLALLPAASGWKLPSNALPNDARIGAATNGGSCGDGSCSRARRQLASGWCARPALAPGRHGLSAPSLRTTGLPSCPQ